MRWALALLGVVVATISGCDCRATDGDRPAAPAEQQAAAAGDPCDRALRTTRLDFDDLSEGQKVAGAYADEGISFFAGGIGAATANATGSPVSGRVYVAGDHEAVDDNPGSEHGNGVPAPPVTFWLHEPGEPERPAVTDVVRLRLVWTNDGSVSHVEAYDPDGTRIFEKDVPSEGGGESVESVCILADDIHRVVVRFGVATADGEMEDNAGIDGLELGPIRPAG